MRRVMHPAIYAAYSGPTPNFMDRPSDFVTNSQRAARASRAAGKFLLSSPTAHFVSATPWYGPNTSSTIWPPMISTRPWKRPPRTIPSTCRSMRHGSCAGRASLKSTDRGRISAGASARISATGLATTRFSRRSTLTNRVGLLYRDLLGAALAGMWSVDALIAEIAVRRPHFIGMSRLLADRPYPRRPARASGWLRSRPMASSLPKTSKHCPTIRRCRFSSCSRRCSSRSEGLCLGPLGSIIVVGSDFRRSRQ